MQFVGMEMSTLLTLAGLTAAAVTVLYILKLRKRRIEVPFSPLWREILLEHKQQSDLWRRFRRLLSWLLHLIMAALLAFALADPHLENEVVEGRHILLLVDSSASMGATDVSGGADRLDVAKKRAHEILETMGPDDRVMLVNFNNQVQPLSPFVSEPSLLEQPLRDIRLAATGTEFTQAVSFAADSLRDESNGELVIITDGAGVAKDAFKDVDFGDQTTVRQLKVGESLGNIAVTAFNVRRYLANKQDFELFLKIQSYFDRSVSAEVQIYADDRLVDTKPITLTAGEVYQKFYPSQAVSGERLEARVKLTSADARDVFPLDDRAYALLPEVQSARVEVVTEGNLYLEGPLLLNPNLEVTRTDPADWKAEPGKFDAVFLDRFTPQIPDQGDYFFIDPSGEFSPWEVRSAIADPIITQVRKTHPLMRWITLKDVNIGSASKLKMTRKDTVVASSALGAAILFTRIEGDRRLAGLSFDVRNSDFPLRVAFPVMLLNVIDWFGGDEGSLVESYKTGETWSIPLQGDAPVATVTDPAGRSTDVPTYEGAAVVYGIDTGFYTIKTPQETLRVAANLVNPTESAIAPSDLEFGTKDTVRDASTLIFDRSELWVWAVLALMLLLMLEWATYNRRITV
jgi:hypothetical protein